MPAPHPQPSIVPDDLFWEAAGSYADSTAANLSLFWASGAITVDPAGRLLLPNTLPHVHDVSAYGYKAFVEDGFCMLVPGNPKPSDHTPIGVALARRIDGVWQLHPSLFMVTSYAAQVRRGVPRCFAAHPPQPASADREDPGFPLWALPRSVPKDALPMGIPEDVLCDMGRLALGAVVAAEDASHAAFCVQVARAADTKGPRFAALVQTVRSGGQYGTVVHCPEQEDQLLAVLERWTDIGRLSPRAAFCHPNLMHERLVDLWLPKSPPTSHARLDALAFFRAETAALQG